MLRSYHRGSGGSRTAVDDDGLGTKCTGSCLDGLQRSQGDCVKKRLWEDQTCRNEILVAAGGDQIGKCENEAVPGAQHLADHVTKGKIVVRDR